MTNDEGGITVEVANEQSLVDLDEQRLRDAVTMILEDAEVRSGTISVAVVDDATIARLHDEYLGDGDPTDVMSFLLERDEDRIEGQVVASAETAVAAADGYGWPAGHELLLYVIHGTLHLVGYGDATPEEKAEMRRQEEFYLARVGVQGRSEQSDAAPPNGGSASCDRPACTGRIGSASRPAPPIRSAATSRTS